MATDGQVYLIWCSNYLSELKKYTKIDVYQGPDENTAGNIRMLFIIWLFYDILYIHEIWI